MYYCSDCKRVFESHKVVREPVPYGEGYAFFNDYQCPYCNSSDTEDCEMCECCEEFCAESRLIYNDYVDKWVCPECDKELKAMQRGGKNEM